MALLWCTATTWMPELFVAVPPIALPIGSLVKIRSKIVEAVVDSIHWHLRDAKPIYKLSRDGKPDSRRYSLEGLFAVVSAQHNERMLIMETADQLTDRDAYRSHDASGIDQHTREHVEHTIGSRDDAEVALGRESEVEAVRVAERRARRWSRSCRLGCS